MKQLKDSFRVNHHCQFHSLICETRLTVLGTRRDANGHSPLGLVGGTFIQTSPYDLNCFSSFSPHFEMMVN